MLFSTDNFVVDVGARIGIDEFISSGIGVGRGWAKIIRTDILLHTSKTIAPWVKNQARGQNKWSRALKWGMVSFCSLNAFGEQNL